MEAWALEQAKGSSDLDALGVGFESMPGALRADRGIDSGERTARWRTRRGGVRGARENFPLKPARLAIYVSRVVTNGRRNGAGPLQNVQQVVEVPAYLPGLSSYSLAGLRAVVFGR